MAHLHLIEDNQGQLVDYHVFCSDFCNQDYCGQNKLEYQGYFGCQEISINTPCVSCNNLVQGEVDFENQEQTLDQFEQAKRVWESENVFTQKRYP